MPPTKSAKSAKKYTKSAKSAKITFDPIARTESGKQHNTFEHGIPNPDKKMVRKSSFGSRSEFYYTPGEPNVNNRYKSVYDYLANMYGEQVTSPRTMENTEKNKTIVDKASGIRRKTKKSKGKNHKKTIRKNNKKKHTQKKY